MKNILENNIRKVYLGRIYGGYIFTCFLFIYLFFASFPGKVCANTTYVGGRIANDTTWTTIGNPYIVTSAISIYGDTMNAAKLTIEPGVVIKFSNNTGLQIGSGTNKGILRAIGTDAEKIKFTANTNTPTRGYWGRIYIDNNAIDYDTVTGAGTIMENCIVEYGSQLGLADENIYIIQSSPKISKCEIKESRTNGIRMNGGTSNPVIDSNTISNNGTSGIYIDIGNPVISGNAISSNGNYGVYVAQGSAGPVISGNNIKNNGSYPVRVHTNKVRLFGIDNIYSGNNPDMIEVMGATVDIGEVLFKDIGIPYYINGNIIVISSNGYSVRLKVDAGVELKFGKQYGLFFYKYDYNTYPPELKAIGTKDKPIKFTSREAIPSRGDWRGIIFSNGNGLSEMENCIVEYGGYSSSYPGDIYLYGYYGSPRLNISRSIVRYSKEHGIYNNGGTLVIGDSEIRENTQYGIYNVSNSPGIARVVITNNTQGGIYFSNSTPTISYCYIYDNQNYGINNASNSIVNAKYNWWGDITGPLDDNDDRRTNGSIGLYNPQGKGNKVTDYVDYSEWLMPIQRIRDDQLWIKGR